MSVYYEKAKSVIENWFEKANDWQKDLFVSIWNGSEDESKLVSKAIKLIDRDCFSVDCDVSINTMLPKEVDFSEDKSIPIILSSISEVKGVGAIAASSPLSFDSGLTIVYGENGCGKSSYVRILKAIENPEYSSYVINNVFDNAGEQSQAKITFLTDGAENVIEWNKSSTLKYPIQIYDTAVAKNFVEKENEVVYEPKILTMVTKMVNVYSMIAEHYQQKIDAVEQKMGEVPSEISGHALISELFSLSKIKDIEMIKVKCGWSDELEKELIAIEESLKTSDPQKAMSALQAQIEVIRKQQKEIARLYSLISDSSCSEYLNKRNDQIKKKSIADEWISKSKTNSLVRGFGEQEWKEMWSSALKFTRAFYGSNDSIPKTDSNICVLCQQDISLDASARMNFFDDFTKSTAITDSEKAYTVFRDEVVKLQENIDNRIKLNEIEMELRSNALGDDVIKIILELYSNILKRCRWLLEYTDEEEIECPRIISMENFDLAIGKHLERMELQIKNLKEVINSKESQEARRLQLLSMRWISGRIDIKRQLINLNSVLKTCKTNALTTLKKNLSDLLITSAYISRFQSELSVFDIDSQIKVELVSKGAKRGRAYHQVSLRGIRSGEKRKTGEILSEGEFRVVSLAAFLADLSSWNKSMPFVFDDPITSLDQKFEGRVAKRLVNLSSERQVIVFTHRLAFAQLLNEEFNEYNKGALDVEEKNSLTIKNIELRKDPLGQPCAPNFVKAISLNSAMCEFLKNDISKIKKAQQNGEYDVVDFMIKALCSSFRSVIEQGIGQDLLCGIVSRFSRNVSTLKVPMLMAITKEDIELFHKMMSKYSCYEHSQSIETPNSLPDIKSIEADVIVMRDWATEYRKRCKKAQEMYS